MSCILHLYMEKVGCACVVITKICYENALRKSEKSEMGFLKSEKVEKSKIKIWS